MHLPLLQDMFGGSEKVLQSLPAEFLRCEELTWQHLCMLQKLTLMNLERHIFLLLGRHCPHAACETLGEWADLNMVYPVLL